MKSSLEFISTANMSRESWLSYRDSGVGASDVGTILGLNDYKSSLELYYYKIGEIPRFDTETIAQFMGKEHEDMIGDLWQYWEGDEESMIRNYRDEKIVRKCQRVNAYVRNPKYPWLFVSLDRKINKHGGKGEGTLELKTINGYEADKWQSGLPPSYVTQVQTQIVVCEFDYGEMAILQDGRRFFVLPFEKNDNIIGHVVEKTHDFWQRVVKGRKLVNEKFEALRTFNQQRVDEIQHEIDGLAPDPDGSLVYSDFLKERFNRPATSERKGTDEELQAAKAQKEAAEREKEIAEVKTLNANILKKSMGADCQVLDFGPDGKVYWSLTSAGNRVFRNKIKS